MDALSPLDPSSGPLFASSRLEDEQAVVSLCRQIRKLAEQSGVCGPDVRALSLVTYEAARRLSDAGATGEAELGVSDGPSLQIVLRALAPPEVIGKLSGTISSLRSVVHDLSISSTADSLTIIASVPIERRTPAQLSRTPASESNEWHARAARPGKAEMGQEIAEYIAPASGQVLEDLQAELEATNRGAADLYIELAERDDKLREAFEARTKLEDELRRRASDLEAANHAIENFLSTLSHELRTPLNAMLGWTRLLRMGHLDRAASDRALETIERNAHSQEQLIADILDASRIVTGHLRLDIRPVQLAELLTSALESVRPAAEAKQIAVETSIDFRGNINGDPRRLHQVVRNLLVNAITFTPAAGFIRVSLKKKGKGVALTVSDTGQGIPQEFLPYVFDRFRQADASVTRSHGGLGLGLAIVRHVVELHGGRVQVASDGPGLGASFSVRLPVAV